MSRYSLRVSGNHNMVIEGVSIRTETSRGSNAATSEVLVLALSQGFPGEPVLARPPALPGPV
jgi:hypothetical protein